MNQFSGIGPLADGHKSERGVQGGSERSYSPEICRGQEVPLCGASETLSHGESPTLPSDSGFSRHDSLFSFGASSTRNAAELKSFLGSSNSRLKPGATVLPLYGAAADKKIAGAHTVSLEQAKARARVEVDIVLENDCCVEGGYLRGSVKLRVRKRHKKEAHILLADGKLRVIGFESIPGEADRHAFYQRASPLCAVTDAYSRIYDSPADSEGFSRAMEGVHVLPFAMQLSADAQLGSPKGSPCLQSGVSIRYIAMISVKVKDSKTGKRSIAHFYRDCQIWPLLDPAIVLANASRPIHASTAGSLSVIGAGKKVKLTAMLPRMTWLAGQRCYVHLSVTNETKKTVKTIRLALVRTTTVFRPRPALNTGNGESVDPGVCQTATTHKVIAESILERSQGVAKGHASVQGWWTGVPAGQDVQFAHYILINVSSALLPLTNLLLTITSPLAMNHCNLRRPPSPRASLRDVVTGQPDALSVTRSRFIEVEYSIQVSLSAGALTSVIQVTLPIRVVNFLSLDPLPSAPLISLDGSYARLVSREEAGEKESTCFDSAAPEKPGQFWDTPCVANETAPASPCSIPSFGRDTNRGRTVDHVRNATEGKDVNVCSEGVTSGTLSTALHVTNPDSSTRGSFFEAGDGSELAYTSVSDTSLYSAASLTSALDSRTSPLDQTHLPLAPPLPLGNLELPDEVDLGDEVDAILQSISPESPSPGVALDLLVLDEPTVDSYRYGDSGHISTTRDGATPPSSLDPASTTASLRSSDAHRRSVNSRRSGPTPVPEDASLQREVGGTDAASHRSLPRLRTEADSVTNHTSRPVRPERSPLRMRTGTWGPRGIGSGADRGGMTSFERRVQEKKLALLDAHSGSSPQSGHLREPAQCDAADTYRDVDDDCEDTPRLGSTCAARDALIRGALASDGQAVDLAAGSRIRTSRLLPLPPPRLSRTGSFAAGAGQDGCDVAASVSAFDSLRISRSRSRGELPTGASFIAERYSAHPPPLVASTSSSSSSEQPAGSHCYGQQVGDDYTVAPSISGRDVYHRPTEGLHSTGSSDSSIVKGRIAAFEERLKFSHDIGAAYT
ncbi:hypothetical protein VTO73DRAFT_725 [Trametes versicolor]